MGGEEAYLRTTIGRRGEMLDRRDGAVIERKHLRGNVEPRHQFMPER